MASDGGLLVPVSIPKLPATWLRDRNFWVNFTPSDLATLIHRLFIPRSEISDSDLAVLIARALNFPLPIDQLDPDTFVMRLDRGPTASFKDVAARTLAQLMAAYTTKFDKKINIIVATSGDTGVAIADAFGLLPNITVTVLYPDKGVSEIQEKQMLHIHNTYANEQAIPIKGNFDNCQDVAKLLQSARYSTGKEGIVFLAKEVAEKLGQKITLEQVKKMTKEIGGLDLSSANSINIWRLIPQTTQYFAAYRELIKQNKIKPGQEVIFSVPTGNVGHLMAGIYAREIGLPIKNFIIGTNANNIIANVIGNGVIKHRPFKKTSAPSMDILDPSNLERLLAYSAIKTGYRGEINFPAMKTDIKNFSSESQSKPLSVYGVTPKMIGFLQELIWAEDVETDEELYAMMRQTYHKQNLVLETHGTTGLIATLRARSKGLVDCPVIIFETAHPDKFATALVEAGLSKTPQWKHPIIESLKKRPLGKFNKPLAQGINIIKVAEKIATLTRQQKFSK